VETCKGYIEKSLALATGLVPEIGYDRAAAVSKKAHKSGKTIREVLLEEKILSEKEFDAWLKGQFE
jgi:fumarate hydratase class II